jgi:HSP20 family protein
MNVIRWEPFREMQEMLRQYSPMLARGGGGGGGGGGEVAEWRPVADISETDKEYLIKAELPEVKKEDVKITLQDGVLTIRGERKLEKEQKDENAIRVERFYGTFSRSFALPENADPASVRAESKDGVLQVHIPKAQSPKAKPISVEVH